MRIRLDRFNEPILILVVRKKGQNRENWKKKREGERGKAGSHAQAGLQGRPVYVVAVWVGTFGCPGRGCWAAAEGQRSPAGQGHWDRRGTRGDRRGQERDKRPIGPVSCSCSRVRALFRADLPRTDQAKPSQAEDNM